MADRANAGRSGARKGAEKKHPGDVGEPAGTMALKARLAAPHRERVAAGKVKGAPASARGRR